MLKALVDDDRLESDEVASEAFPRMLARLDMSPHAKLSDKERAWVERKFEQLDLGSGDSLNLHSSGKVPSGLTPGRPGVKFPWEAPGYEKPKKPPGRA